MGAYSCSIVGCTVVALCHFGHTYVRVLWYSVTGVGSIINVGYGLKNIKTWKLRLGSRILLFKLLSRWAVCIVTESRTCLNWWCMLDFIVSRIVSGSFTAFVPNLSFRFRYFSICAQRFSGSSRLVIGCAAMSVSQLRAAVFWVLRRSSIVGDGYGWR